MNIQEHINHIEETYGIPKGGEEVLYLNIGTKEVISRILSLDSNDFLKYQGGTLVNKDINQEDIKERFRILEEMKTEIQKKFNYSGHNS